MDFFLLNYSLEYKKLDTSEKSLLGYKIQKVLENIGYVLISSDKEKLYFKKYHKIPRIGGSFVLDLFIPFRNLNVIIKDVNNKTTINISSFSVWYFLISLMIGTIITLVIKDGLGLNLIESFISVIIMTTIIYLIGFFSAKYELIKTIKLIDNV